MWTLNFCPDYANPDYAYRNYMYRKGRGPLGLDENPDYTCPD